MKHHRTSLSLAAIAFAATILGAGLSTSSAQPRAPILECLFNRDCEGFMVCHAGYCRHQCVDALDCPHGQSCVAGARDERGVAIPIFNRCAPRPLRKWERAPGALRQISAAGAQTVWGVNAANDVFAWCGSNWVAVPGEKLRHISVGAPMTWATESASPVMGITVKGDLVRWSGVTQPTSCAAAPAGRWIAIRHDLKEPRQLALGPYGTAVHEEGLEVYFQDGAAWRPLARRFKSVSIGPGEVLYTVAADGKVEIRYLEEADLKAKRYTGGHWISPGWTLDAIAATAGLGHLWGLRGGVPQRLEDGTWIPTPAPAPVVSLAASATEAWAVDGADRVFRFR